MKNPFKFGSIVSDEFFTDRITETRYVQQYLDSQNHLILISPRRYCKTSLVYRALQQANISYIAVNLQGVTGSVELASVLLKKLLDKHPFERLKQAISRFRIVPTLKLDPTSGNMDVSFFPEINGSVAIEDVLRLIDSVSSAEHRQIVVFDEFQSVLEFEKGLDKKLRAVMQELCNVNFILLGSQESMMTDIFEKKKSPFYHFGNLIRLKKIPYDDFLCFIEQRLRPVVSSRETATTLAAAILTHTQCHPYYTQQLCAEVWQLLRSSDDRHTRENVINMAIEQIRSNHDIDYERLWLTFTLNERKILKTLAKAEKVSRIKEIPTSTVYSVISKLVKDGYVIKEEEFMLEDPFFGNWILNQN